MAQQTLKLRDGQRRETILRDLRERIVSGEWPPGFQLPSHSELRQTFRASPVTVQAALDDLAADGFVLTASRKGTFVADHPPHLARYGLVFPWRPRDDQHFSSRYFTALRNEAARLSRSEPRSVKVFYDGEGHGITNDYRTLSTSVVKQAVAGLIFATPPFRLGDTPVMTHPGIPRVVIMDGPEFHNASIVRVDMRSFFDRAADHLAARGRRRIGLVTVASMESALVNHFVAAVRLRGMTTHDVWVHGVHPASTRWAKPLVELMLTGPADERPDGLVVADDNLAEAATAGVMASGVNAAADLDVVVHCNLPWPPPTMVPVARLGFDIGRVLRTAIDLVDDHRRTDGPPAVVPVPAQFDWELPKTDQGTNQDYTSFENGL